MPDSGLEILVTAKDEKVCAASASPFSFSSTVISITHHFLLHIATRVSWSLKMGRPLLGAEALVILGLSVVVGVCRHFESPVIGSETIQWIARNTVQVVSIVVFTLWARVAADFALLLVYRGDTHTANRLKLRAARRDSAQFSSHGGSKRPPRPDPLPLTATTSTAARTPAAAPTPSADYATPAEGFVERYTAAVVILGFLRKTDPPFNMNSTREERAEANYSQVGMTECLALRVRKGAAQYHKLRKYGERAVVIVSGGDPQKLGSTEAELMTAELEALEVPISNIVQEDKARHTIENGVFVCSNIIEARMPTVTSIYVVTNEFHGERSWQIFSQFTPPGASLHRCFAEDGDHDVMFMETGRKFKVSPNGVQDDPRSEPPTWTSEERRQLSDHNVGALLHKNIRAYSELMVAVKSGNLWAVQHAPITKECRQMRGGAGPFHYACLFAMDSKIIKELLWRAELRPLAAVLSTNGCTALHFLPFSPAFEGGEGTQAQAIRTMLHEAGCPRNVRGTSALWIGERTAEELWAQESACATEGRPLSPGRQTRRQSFVAFSVNREFVALREAARVGDLEGVRSWIREHPDESLEPTLPDSGSSPLHYACGADGDADNKVAIVTALLCANADVNHLNNYGASPLHCKCGTLFKFCCPPSESLLSLVAVWNQHEELVRVLLRHGCKTLTQRGDGFRWDVPQTPIELAFRQAAAAKPKTVAAHVARNILGHLTTAQYTWRVTQQTLPLVASSETGAPSRAVSAPTSLIRRKISATTHALPPFLEDDVPTS